MSKNVRQEMLSWAKKIASKKYTDRVERVRNLRTLEYSDYLIPASEVKNDEIDWVLKNNPRFDESEFKKMIRQQEAKNKEDRLENQ